MAETCIFYGWHFYATVLSGNLVSKVHAGGLRYHGMSPMISHLKELGDLEATAAHQTACFKAGHIFWKSEGILAWNQRYDIIDLHNGQIWCLVGTHPQATKMIQKYNVFTIDLLMKISCVRSSKNGRFWPLCKSIISYLWFLPIMLVKLNQNLCFM